MHDLISLQVSSNYQFGLAYQIDLSCNGRSAQLWVQSCGVLSQWQQGQQGTYCIVAIEDKKMGFISYCLSLSLYIMSSCLMCYSVLRNLILQMHARQRSMCAVIVVDAESFWSTCRGRDAYIHDHAQIFLIIIHFSINCSTVICTPTVILMLS